MQGREATHVDHVTDDLAGILARLRWRAERISVPDNVEYFVNFYQNNGFGRTAAFPPSRQKRKVNLNLTTSPGMTHSNIDQSRRLQDIVMARIVKITAQ